MSRSSVKRIVKRRKYRENVQGSSKELKYFQYDESYNTCIDIRDCMRELGHKLKECKPGIPGTPIDLQEVRKYAKNTFHKLVHRFNKELGIEFSENEEVKNELDTSRLRNDHYHEIKNCKQEQTPSEKYIIELEQKCEKDLLRQSQEEIKRIQQEHVNEMKKYQQLQEKQIKSQTQIETLHTELESIKEKENKLKQNLHDMLEDRDRLQQEIQQIRREYKPYEQFADELNQQLQERNVEIHRLREELQKYISTNGDQIKEIDKLRISYLEAIEGTKNLTERLINKAPSVLPPDFLEKEGTKCQPFIRRSEVISMLLKSQGNKNDMSINESDENNQEKNLTTIEEAVLEDRVCWNETSSSMRMNKMETHTTVYNISTSNVNMNTHCTVKQSDGVLSVEPGDPGVSMLTENES